MKTIKSKVKKIFQYRKKEGKPKQTVKINNSLVSLISKGKGITFDNRKASKVGLPYKGHEGTKGHLIGLQFKLSRPRIGQKIDFSKMLQGTRYQSIGRTERKYFSELYKIGFKALSYLVTSTGKVNSKEYTKAEVIKA